VKLRLLLFALLASACSRPAPYTVSEPVQTSGREAASAAPAHAPGAAADASGEPPLRVLLFGDFGDPNAQQRAVAEMMIGAHRRQPFDLAISLGDNVYNCGLDVTLPGARECEFDESGNTLEPGYEAPRDPRFEERFERPLLPFASDPKPLHVYGVLGNHDVASGVRCREGGLGSSELGRVRACLQVAQRSQVWRMPGRHYAIDKGAARFVVIDSNLLLGDYGGFSIDGEIDFVRDAVRTAAGRRVFLVAHHPAATAGTHRDDFRPAYLDRLRRVLEAGGGDISAWFAGHDHILQHVRAPGGLDAFVSGNGARGRPNERFEDVEPDDARVLFGSTEWGFAVLEVTRSGWSVRFETDRGKPLHCCRAVGSGPCEPVACTVRQTPVGAR
jgi:3',5'-cyclic AMP phosphodiesterase CpdA